MSWLIPPKPHPLLLFSPFSLLFSFIYITHSNPPLLYFPSLSPSVTTPRSHVTLSPHTLSLLSSSSVTTPVLMLPCPLQLCYYPSFLCYSVSSYPVTSYSVSPVSPPCRVKNVYLSYPQGPLLCPRQGLSSMQNMPFLEKRVQVFDSKDLTIVKETDMMSFSKWFG